MDKVSPSPSCVLYQNETRNVVCIDIPRSIEEAQVPRGETPTRRLISVSPITTPFLTPESKNGSSQLTAGSPSTQIAQLMVGAAVQDALLELESFSGPYCLPRVTMPQPGVESTTESSSKRFIPQDSHPFVGTVEEKREEFASTAPQFELIVMDPPWPNRSAKRKRKNYSTCYGPEDTRRLLSLLPIQKHLAPRGLVAVWVTNSHSMTDILTAKDGIFSEWGLEVVGEWIWLKVTASGEPIVDVDSTWRKPWERLLIAQRRGDAARDIVDRKVIVGVPDIHSRKPNLRRLFDDVLPQGYQALEVFARHLTSGWWSWGNEAMLHQHDACWTE